jgi:hypothetical protein
MKMTRYFEVPPGGGGKCILPKKKKIIIKGKYGFFMGKVLFTPLKYPPIGTLAPNV